MATTVLPRPNIARRSRRNRWWLPVLLLLVLAGAGVFYYQRTRAQAAATTTPVTATVTRGAIQATVSATGNIQPASQVNLNFVSGGTVKEVLVKEGDVVKAGQPLVRLDATDLALAVAANQSSLDNAKLKLQQAQQGPKDTDITAAQAKVDSAKAALNGLYKGATAADVTDAQARIVSAQAQLAKAKAGPTDQDVANAQQKIEQAKNALWGAQSNRDAICGRAKHPDDDPSCQQQRANVNQQEANVQMAQNDLAKLTAGPDPNDMTVAEQNLKQAQAALAKLREGPTAADVAQAQANITSAQAALEAAKAGPDDLTIQVAQTAVDQAEIALKQSQLKLDQATLTAPFDGVVTAVTAVAGQSVGASANPVQLSDLNQLQVVTNVSELDRARLKVGQTVDVSLEALPNVTLKGEVTKISPTGVTQQGVVTFPVTVELRSADSAASAGMTANLNIIVESKDGVLRVPNRAIQSQGKQKVVNVLREGQTVAIPVQAGVTDGTQTEVTSADLREGDTVIVNGTTAASANANRGGGPGAGGPPPGNVLLGR